ncbi:hypothetical protein BRC84_00860 [Halobacteriales archaeon QS_1_68_44]|nr:MAG: hypothetical protein BRC84_00860 [Halobacteriales archaeon QS_1_68_44]
MTGQDRAQTPLDFAIAMGIFLLTVTFVFTFIPSLTAPFIDDDQDKSATADRVASHLAEGALGDPGDPFVVNDSCAEVFFDESTVDSDIHPNCGFSDNGDGDYDLGERVGVDTDRLQVNVTVEQIDPDAAGDARFRTVCIDDGNGEVSHAGNTSVTCNEKFAVGETADADDSVVVARRIVTIPGCTFDTESCDVTLRVEVW